MLAGVASILLLDTPHRTEVLHELGSPAVLESGHLNRWHAPGAEKGFRYLRVEADVPKVVDANDRVVVIAEPGLRAPCGSEHGVTGGAALLCSVPLPPVDF